MFAKRPNSGVICILFATMAFLLVPALAGAHCDTMDGPVITDAKQALDQGNVNPVLKWVTNKDEQEIIEAFNKTLAVRTGGPEARELADHFFFETLVRIHRAGEGAPYTGLKPAGSIIDSSVVAADKAVATGSVDILAEKISDLVADGIRRRFEKVLKTEALRDEGVDAGREYVEAYIEFVHFVERIHLDASNGDLHHEH